ncbi:MAG: O-antigen ligase family protein [Gemmatimonadota bacterium]
MALNPSGAFGAISGMAGGREASVGLRRAVFLFLLIVVFKLHSMLPPLPRPALLLAPFVLLMAWNQSSPAERQLLSRNRMLQGVVGYFAWGVLTIPTSVYRGQSFDVALGLVPLVLMVVAVSLLPAALRTVDLILMTMLTGGGLLGLGSLVYNNRTLGRLSAPAMFDPNDLGAVMSATAPIALGLLLRAKGWRRLVALMVLVICAWTLVQTSSRGSSIGFAVGILTVILATGGARRAGGLAILLVGGMIFMANLPESYRERMANVGESDYNTTDYYGRMAVWRRGTGYALDNPLLGVGLGAFQTAEGNTLTEMGRPGRWMNAHNGYVQALAELGFPGGLLYVSLIVGGIVVALRHTSLARKRKPPPQDTRPEIAGAMMGLAVAGFFLSFAYFAMWYLLWALASLLSRIPVGRQVVATQTSAQPALRGAPMRPSGGWSPVPPPMQPVAQLPQRVRRGGLRSSRHQA